MTDFQCQILSCPQNLKWHAFILIDFNWIIIFAFQKKKLKKGKTTNLMSLSLHWSKPSSMKKKAAKNRILHSAHSGTHTLNEEEDGNSKNQPYFAYAFDWISFEHVAIWHCSKQRYASHYAVRLVYGMMGVCVWNRTIRMKIRARFMYIHISKYVYRTICLFVAWAHWETNHTWSHHMWKRQIYMHTTSKQLRSHTHTHPDDHQSRSLSVLMQCLVENVLIICVVNRMRIAWCFIYTHTVRMVHNV